MGLQWRGSSSNCFLVQTSIFIGLGSPLRCPLVPSLQIEEVPELSILT